MRIKLCGFVVWAVFLACGLMSCQQEDRPHGVQYPIVFSNSSETRATATKDDLKEDGFTVYAFVQGNAGSTSFAKDVVYNATYDVWAFESPEYWIPNTAYYFKAFYPMNMSGLSVANSSETQNFTITGYDITSQTDLLVAEAQAVVNPGETAPTGGSVVKLNFQHLLANVTINVLCELSSGVTVDRVEFRNVTTKGNYNSSWSAVAKSDFGINCNKSINMATSDTDSVDITNGGFLVIPEQINGTQKVYVKTSFKEYEIAFPTKYSWNSGQKYSYTLVVKQENIEFNEPKVEIWDEENATGSVVIK